MPEYRIARPFVAFGRGFAALALLFVIFTPFMSDLPVSRITFLMLGLAYSAALSFLGTGVALLPPPMRRRVNRGLVWLMAAVALWFAAILTTLCYGVSWAFVRIELRVAVWFGGVALAILIGLGCYGWYCRLRTTK